MRILGGNQENADFARGPRSYFLASALSFFSFLYTHGKGNSSSFRCVQRKLPRLSSLEHDVDFA